ncbi:MAG TPA: arylesterase [Bryobacteraceae bacterium]|nr:arylesterase [Bryobacteraceae bacterium]
MRILIFLTVAAFLCACSKSRDDAGESRAAPPSSAPATPPAIPQDNRPIIAVFGDSISAGFGLPTGKSFPDFLQKKLDAEGKSFHVVNLGISGDTTAEGVARIDSATSLHPQVVVLELGGNDGLRGMPIAATRANLDQMILAFEKSGAKVVLAGMTLPPNYGPDYIHDFEKIYRDLAAQDHAALIPFLMSDILTRDLRYLQADGIHPTAAGSEIIAGTVLRALQPLLK